MFIMESLPSHNNSTPGPGERPQRSAWSRSNLTLSQWLLWYEQRRHAPYIFSPLSVAFTFYDSLDTRNFRQAFQSVVDRSDALRTVFIEDDGLPQRYVLPRLPLAMDLVDLSAAYQPAAAYEQWIAERDLRPLSPALRPFDSTLVRLGDRHFVWRLTLHRLIADSHSLLLVYRYTAEAYAAIIAGAADALGPLPSFEDYARYDRARVDSAAFSEPRSSLHSPARFSLPLPVPGERYLLDLGAERTAALRRKAANLSAGKVDGSSALLPLFATGLAALLARQRRCRSICIDTDLDMRHLGPWQDTIGRINRSHTLTVEVTHDESLAGLVGKLGKELDTARRSVQAAPISALPAAACRALLQVDASTFPSFLGSAVKVERLDVCYGQRKLGEQRETKMEPSICLRIDGYASRESLQAMFTFCSGYLVQGRGPELAREYLRLLDALLLACEQPLHSLRWGR